jgi:hypothetical protein
MTEMSSKIDLLGDSSKPKSLKTDFIPKTKKEDGTENLERLFAFEIGNNRTEDIKNII